MKEKNTRFLESDDSYIKKLVANAFPESARKSTKYAVNVFVGESYLNTESFYRVENLIHCVY